LTSRNNGVVIVTGGAGNLGVKICEALNLSGWTPVALDSQLESLNLLPDTIEGYQVDASNEIHMRAALEEIELRLGPVRHLVNNAGRIHNGTFVRLDQATELVMTYEDFVDVFNDNFRPTFSATAAVVNAWVRRRQSGAIINISSIVAPGNAGQLSYAAAKSSINTLTVTLANELSSFKIRVNAIAPGFIETASTRTNISEQKIKEIVDRTPARRLGLAEEIAHAVVFLLENEFMNGQIVNASGGYRI
jgi:3-oxoacyl-[acyl-carrier protein] reductase